MKSLERLPDRDGMPAWIEDVERHEDAAGTSSAWSVRRSLVTRIADPYLPFGGTWTYRIAPRVADPS